MSQDRPVFSWEYRAIAVVLVCFGRVGLLFQLAVLSPKGGFLLACFGRGEGLSSTRYYIPVDSLGCFFCRVSEGVYELLSFILCPSII